jgi:hypothetical protein
MRDETLKRRDLNVSHTLGYTVKQTETVRLVVVTEDVRRPGQTHKKPKDLSVCDREERGRGEGGGVYAVCIP